MALHKVRGILLFLFFLKVVILAEYSDEEGFIGPRLREKRQAQAATPGITGVLVPRDFIIQVIDLRNITTVAQEAVARKRQSERFFLQIGVDNVPIESTVGLHNIFIATQPDAKIFGDAGIAIEAVSRVISDRLRLSGRDFQIPTDIAATGTTGTGPQPNEQRVAQVPCPYRRPTCDQRAIYRTADGSCNNLRNADWGMSDTPQRRFLPSRYDDGVSVPRRRSVTGNALPSPRLVSTIVHEENPSASLQSLTHILMQWGQFVDHDITSTPIDTGLDSATIGCCIQDVGEVSDPRIQVDNRGFITRDECFPIEIPVGDHRFGQRRCMNFVRSLPAANRDCRFGSREQLNQITAFIDGSMVYGEQTAAQQFLRSGNGGLLRSRGNFLPEDSEPTCLPSGRGDYCFKAGDDRVNEQSSLASLQTILMREHNNIAGELGRLNRNWDDEKLFQESRKIIGAVLQHITYTEWLPIVLGQSGISRHNLQTNPNGFNHVYNANVDPSIRSAFSTAAFRFGHSLVQSFFSQFGQGYSSQFATPMPLQTMYANTLPTLENSGDGINTILRGLVSDAPQACDRYLTKQVTDHLFEDSDGNALDLAALNINRGRDHGLPSYNEWRRFCGLQPATQTSFPDHTPDAARRLLSAYQHPDDIDLFAGGVSERPRDGIVGPTFSCIIGQQFSFLQRGDRFWYENSFEDTGFTSQQLAEIKKMSLARLLCDTTSIQSVQPAAFQNAFGRNGRLPCSQIPSINLRIWQEGQTFNPQSTWTNWSNWSGCRNGQRFRQRFCFGATPCPGSNVDVQACQTQQNCVQFPFGFVCTNQ